MRDVLLGSVGGCLASERPGVVPALDARLERKRDDAIKTTNRRRPPDQLRALLALNRVPLDETARDTIGEHILKDHTLWEAMDGNTPVCPQSFLTRWKGSVAGPRMR